MSLVYFENPDWAGGPLPLSEDDGWEPWEPDEQDAVEGACCEYCGTVENIRESPDPFGQKQCCEGCFSVLIGGEYDDAPWRCGTESRGDNGHAKTPPNPHQNGRNRDAE